MVTTQEGQVELKTGQRYYGVNKTQNEDDDAHFYFVISLIHHLVTDQYVACWIARFSSQISKELNILSTLFSSGPML